MNQKSPTNMGRGIVMRLAMVLVIAGIGVAMYFNESNGDARGAIIPILITIGVVMLMGVGGVVARNSTIGPVVRKFATVTDLMGFDKAQSGPGNPVFRGIVNMQQVEVMIAPGPTIRILVRGNFRTRATIRAGQSGGASQFDEPELSKFTITAQDTDWIRQVLTDWDGKDAIQKLLGDGSGPGIRLVSIEPDHLQVVLRGIPPAQISEDDARKWLSSAADLSKAAGRYQLSVPDETPDMADDSLFPSSSPTPVPGSISGPPPGTYPTASRSKGILIMIILLVNILIAGIIFALAVMGK